jgi:hypothetical protein
MQTTSVVGEAKFLTEITSVSGATRRPVPVSPLTATSSRAVIERLARLVWEGA